MNSTLTNDLKFTFQQLRYDFSDNEVNNLKQILDNFSYVSHPAQFLETLETSLTEFYNRVQRRRKKDTPLDIKTQDTQVFDIIKTRLVESFTKSSDDLKRVILQWLLHAITQVRLQPTTTTNGQKVAKKRKIESSVERTIATALRNDICSLYLEILEKCLDPKTFEIPKLRIPNEIHLNQKEIHLGDIISVDARFMLSCLEKDVEWIQTYLAFKFPHIVSAICLGVLAVKVFKHMKQATDDIMNRENFLKFVKTLQCKREITILEHVCGKFPLIPKTIINDYLNCLLEGKWEDKNTFIFIFLIVAFMECRGLLQSCANELLDKLQDKKLLKKLESHFQNTMLDHDGIVGVFSHLFRKTLVEFGSDTLRLLNFLLAFPVKDENNSVCKLLINIITKLQQDTISYFCFEMGLGDVRLNSQRVLFNLREHIPRIITLTIHNKDFVSDFWAHILELIGLASGETVCAEILLGLLKRQRFPLKKFKILYTAFEKNYIGLEELFQQRLLLTLAQPEDDSEIILKNLLDWMTSMEYDETNFLFTFVISKWRTFYPFIFIKGKEIDTVTTVLSMFEKALLRKPTVTPIKIRLLSQALVSLFFMLLTPTVREGDETVRFYQNLFENKPVNDYKTLIRNSVKLIACIYGETSYAFELIFGIIFSHIGNYRLQKQRFIISKLYEQTKFSLMEFKNLLDLINSFFPIDFPKLSVNQDGQLSKKPTLLEQLNPEEKITVKKPIIVGSLDTLRRNEMEVIELISSCIYVGNMDKNIESFATQLMRKIRVSYITPTYQQYSNVLPKKPIFEKDIFVDKLFNQFPILYSIFGIIAEELLKFSDFVHSLLANCIGEWNTLDPARDPPSLLMNKTITLLSYLQKAQWLAPPLCYVNEILAYITAGEIKQILMHIWHFIFKYPPKQSQYILVSGELSQNEKFKVYKRNFPELRDMQSYMESTKDALRNHIEQLAPYYPQFF